MSAYDGPSRTELLDGLKKLVHGGMDAEWLLNNGDEFFDLAAVQAHLSDDVAPVDDYVDAAKDPRVVALTSVMNKAIDMLALRETRRLLRSILGMYKETRGLKVGERRKKAGEFFRGPAGKVSGGTIRTHYELPALEKLSWLLLKMEAEARDQELPKSAPLDN
jgi:hypothetical protein